MPGSSPLGSDGLRAGRIAALAADGVRGFSWFDGGPHGWGWLGVEPDEEVETDDADDLAAVEAAWRCEPRTPWLGWLTYDLGAATLLGEAVEPGRLPGLAMRRYPGAVRLGPGGGAAPVSSAGADLLRQLGAMAPLAPGPWGWEPLKPTMRPEAYRRMISAGLGYIAAGETYQLNLSQRFEAHVAAADRGVDSARLAARTYLDLRRRAPAPMGALVDAGGKWIVSNSPETLVEIDAPSLTDDASSAPDVARSMPIKGTRPRVHGDAPADQEQVRALVASIKDRAEHVMIVDLVRNDLGRLARPGSVRADSTPTVVTLPTVHHLVTTVSCTLRPDWSLTAAMASLFPGGSITGAPKRRTVELIRALEGEPREVYCGALVALHGDGIHVSIPIRTAVVDGPVLTLRSGGGIVSDSDPEAERLETLDKARAFDPKAP